MFCHPDGLPLTSGAMRTTSSRFNAFVASVDANLEGRPAPTPSAPATVPDARKQFVVVGAPPSCSDPNARLLWGYPEEPYFEQGYSGRDSSLNLAPMDGGVMVLARSIRESVRSAPQQPPELYGSSRLSDPWKLRGWPLGRPYTAVSREASGHKWSATRFIRCVVIQVQNNVFRALHPDAALTFERFIDFAFTVDSADPSMTSDGVIST